LWFYLLRISEYRNKFPTRSCFSISFRSSIIQSNCEAVRHKNIFMLPIYILTYQYQCYYLHTSSYDKVKTNNILQFYR
jgi:hypothetical protein